MAASSLPEAHLLGVTGNLEGLKPSQKRNLERLLHRRVPQDVLLSRELAQALAAASYDIGRQVGLLIGRTGHVEAAFCGEATRIYLPDVGRSGSGPRQYRGLRHVHTVFGQGHLREDDRTDLTRLGLDAVAVLGVDDNGGAKDLAYALRLPKTDNAEAKALVREEYVADVGQLPADFLAVIGALGQEQGRLRSIKVAHIGPLKAVILGAYPERDSQVWRLAELQELCKTAGVPVVDTITQLRKRVDAKFVVGEGKLTETVLRCLDADASLIIVDHALTPAQARAMAAFTELKIIDRTQLILDIFAQHATSRDGKLQVELAQLRYTLPRLTDMDAGLSRLTGGIGGRGPGETKLEINRRRARDRISRLEKEIAQLSSARNLRRHKRQQSGVPVISIVGYTNAGKSTLLNRLTHSAVWAADQLFATLDPVSRRLRFPKAREAVITDTVGFIHDLPKDLLKAFRATLEELEGADLLLHVVDASDPRRSAKAQAVEALLEELGLGGIPRLLVYNKVDMLEPFVAHAISQGNGSDAPGVAVSAHSGAGLPILLQEVALKLWQADVVADRAGWLAGWADDFNISRILARSATP